MTAEPVQSDTETVDMGMKHHWINRVQVVFFSGCVKFGRQQRSREQKSMNLLCPNLQTWTKEQCVEAHGGFIVT